jgi:hypothetical protein
MKRLALLSLVGGALLTACGGPSTKPEDLKPSSRSTRPPSLVLGQGAGLAPVSGGGHQVSANLGAPVVKPVSNSQHTLQPGLMPQTAVR